MKLVKANLSFTYDKDNFNTTAKFFGIYILLGFREFPLRKINDRTVLSSQTFTVVNNPTPISFALLNQTEVIDNQGIADLESKDFYFNDILSDDNFRVGSIYIRSRLIFDDISPNIEVGITINTLVLSVDFQNETTGQRTSVEYKPTVGQNYQLNYLNGEKIYLIHA